MMVGLRHEKAIVSYFKSGYPVNSYRQAKSRQTNDYLTSDGDSRTAGERVNMDRGV